MPLSQMKPVYPEENARQIKFVSNNRILKQSQFIDIGYIAAQKLKKIKNRHE
jgi:hypothetical protein